MQVKIEYKLAETETKLTDWSAAALYFDDARSLFSDFLKLIGAKRAIIFGIYGGPDGQYMTHRWENGIEILSSK